ncbi:MAG: response regulator [Anaerolineae bacterium]|nr:response regulator [Anaerolineae bacterium]
MNSQPNILYVEDEPRSRTVMEMVATYLELPGMTIFEDSTDFLARAEAVEPRPDLVLLDIHLKPHNGFEMLSMLRQSPRFQGVPIVAMTASVMNEEVDQLRTAGFDGCLAKPIDMMTFGDTLDLIVRGENVWRIFS